MVFCTMELFFFLFLRCNGTEFAVTEATNDQLLFQSRMRMCVEQSLECLVGEIEVFGEKLPSVALPATN